MLKKTLLQENVFKKGDIVCIKTHEGDFCNGQETKVMEVIPRSGRVYYMVNLAGKDGQLTKVPVQGKYLELVDDDIVI